ncbi:putative membrane protein [Chitinophaga costaii]|uniref:Putative membrane protein n=1 Tax=Chitinophaga costaii TaxID=1335309 RepID=A0A1C4ADA4_9BACT|nr:phage holin family protein [Chitinophaga costaii]PUZ26564.1 phage holin family protein [Chitinophaga costaii]SCB92658.1 putative membrane protein [Chitinophaga costaii]
MNIFFRLIISALAAFATAYILPGVHLDSFWSAIILAVVLGLLNIFLKPLLVLLTFPITVFTLGLFLLIINAVIILLAAKLVSGFHVDGFWWALLFSLVMTLINSVLVSLGPNEQRGA